MLYHSYCWCANVKCLLVFEFSGGKKYLKSNFYSKDPVMVAQNLFSSHLKFDHVQCSTNRVNELMLFSKRILYVTTQFQIPFSSPLFRMCLLFAIETKSFPGRKYSCCCSKRWVGKKSIPILKWFNFSKLDSFSFPGKIVFHHR